MESQEHQQQYNVIECVPNPTNVIRVVNGKLGLEAVEDKILIRLDRFKSGYECQTCKGEGILKYCICVTEKRPGQNRLGGDCKICNGKGIALKDFQCPDCNGRGATIIIPESAKTLPTSGIIVSVGPQAKLRKIGERVLFGAHTGYFIPFKGNTKIRCMREDEILCLLYSYLSDGEEQMNMGDAIDEEAVNAE